jgi:mRNA-degrading endonuclease toxin of MazEF toxin-antitoxin module
VRDRQNGLRKTSFALIDQIRSVDKRRIERVFGKVTANEMAAIDEGLLLFLGLA